MFSRISPNQEFFSKIQPSLLYLYNPLTSCKKLEKSFDLFLRKLRYQPTNQPNISVSDFGPIWSRFHKNLQIKTFFQKSGSVTFLPLQPPNVIQKTRKILQAVSEKTALPTNQLLLTTLILWDLTEVGPTIMMDALTRSSTSVFCPVFKTCNQTMIINNSRIN